MDGFMQFAQKLVKSVSNISPFPISLSDENGYIIGDGNPDRIGTIHSPSLDVLKANTTLLFHEADIKDTENVLPGVAIPLTFDQKTVAVLGIIGDPIQVEPFAILVKNYVEMMWQETFRQQIDEMKSNALETFVQYLLSTDDVTPESVAQYCEMFHITYHQKRFCIIVDIGNSLLEQIKDAAKTVGTAPLKEALLNSTKQSFGVNKETICTFVNTEKIILLHPVSSDDAFLQIMERFPNQCQQLIQQFQNDGIHHVSIAAGSPYPTLNHIKRAYTEAEDLLKAGKKLHISPPIYHYYSWEVQLALLPMQMQPSFHEKSLLRLKPLLEKGDFNVLAKNFFMYCTHNMNVSKTAKALYIHRNTLIYRLKKIETITAIDTGNFEHCMLLYLLLKDYVHKEEF